MPATNEIAPPLNHVFVDFENVPQIDASVIGAKSVNFTLLLGAKQTKLDAALVEKLMEHAASVQLIRLASSGKNALDFALAYYVGRTVIVDPAAYIHIVSKDTGFDPLVEHLRKNLTNRPKKKKTLLSHLKSQLGKAATDADADGLLEKLQKDGHLHIGDKDAVTYHV